MNATRHFREVKISLPPNVTGYYYRNESLAPKLSLNESFFLNPEECIQQMEHESTNHTLIYAMIILLSFCIILLLFYSCHIYRLLKKNQVKYNSLILNTRNVYKNTNEELVTLTTPQG